LVKQYVENCVLDNYLENCVFLQIFPKFLKFKPPKLKVYQDAKELYQIMLNRKLNSVKCEQRKATKLFDWVKNAYSKN